MMIGQRPARGLDPYMPQPMIERPAILDAPPIAVPQAAPAKPKINWLGVLADALSGAAGQPGMYAQRMQQERREQSALERGEEQYQRRRMDDREDKIWQRDNAPRAPYRWESNDGSLMEMGPQGPVVVYKDPTPKEKWVFDPVRGYVNMNAMAPAAAPNRLDALPPGARMLPSGGQSQPATGGFPY